MILQPVQNLGKFWEISFFDSWPQFTGLRGVGLFACPEFSPNLAPGGVGHWPRKGVRGCAALKTPFHASPVVRKGSISSKSVTSQNPLLRKFGNFSLNSLNFCKNFSSQASKFGNFQFTSPQIWNFCTSPLFQRQMSVRKPPTSEIQVPGGTQLFSGRGVRPGSRGGGTDLERERMCRGHDPLL